MTTPRPSVTPRVGVLIPFIILSDSDDEVTTLPVRHAPPSPDYVLASPDYSPDSDQDSYPSEDDSPGEDLTDTAMSLHTQTALTSVVHPPPTRPLSTSSTIVLRPGQEILLPSSSSPPPSLLPSSSSPPPSLLPSLSHRRSRSPSPQPPPLVLLPPPAVPLPPPTALSLPLPAVLLPSPEHIEPVRDHIETLRARFTSAKQETMTLRARVESLEQHDVVTQDSLRIARGRITWLQLRAVYAEQEVTELQDFWVTDRLEILELRSRAEYAETRLERSHNKQTRDEVYTQRAVMIEHDVEALRASVRTHIF
ncbi:hypothetical protein Tco_1379317 [Tanacetum coccineum]